MVNHMMNAIDTTGMNEISFFDFADMFTQNENSKVYDAVKTQYYLLQEMFELFDDDGSGQITTLELTGIVQKFGKQASALEIRELVKHVDYTDDGSIGFVEFVHMLAGNTTVVQRFINQQIIEFRQAFALFDPDGGGNIDAMEFQQVMNLLGEGAAGQMEALRQMVEDAGEVNFIGFVGMMASEDPTIQSKLRAQVVSFRELFNLFDPSNTGLIGPEILIQTLSVLGFDSDEEELRKHLEAVDLDGDGEIDFTEFVCMLANARMSPNSNAIQKISEMREAFAMYDADGGGTLDVNEIHNTMVELGQNVSRVQAQAMMDAVDDDGDGEIGFKEFLRMMHTPATIAESKRAAANDVDLGHHTEEIGPHTLQKLLKGVKDDERSQEFGARVFKVVKHLVKVPFLLEMSDIAGADLCKEMKLVEYDDDTLVYTQNEYAFDLNIVLYGALHVYQRSNSWTSYQLIDGSKNGLWEIVNHVVQDLMKQLDTLTGTLPSAGLVEYTTKTREMTTQLDGLAKGWYTWHYNASEKVLNGLSDVRAWPALARQGMFMYTATYDFILVVDEVRRENVLKQSNLQMRLNGASPAERSQLYPLIGNATDMLHSCKQILTTLKATIAALQPVFVGHQPEDQKYLNQRPKKSKVPEVDAEHPRYGKHLGTFTVPHSFGDVGFIGGDDAKWPTTIISAPGPPPLEKGLKRTETSLERTTAKPTGIILARLTRRQWREAMIKEPLEFLASLPYFEDLRPLQLEELAALATLRKLVRYDPLVRANELATEIFIIKSGQLKESVSLDNHLQKPHRGPKTIVPHRERRRRKSIAVVGTGNLVFAGADEYGGAAATKGVTSKPDRHTTDIIADSREVLVYALPTSLLEKYPSIIRRYQVTTLNKEELRMDHTKKTRVVMSQYNTRKEVKRRAKADAAAIARPIPPLPVSHVGFRKVATKARQCVSNLGNAPSCVVGISRPLAIGHLDKSIERKVYEEQEKVANSPRDALFADRYEEKSKAQPSMKTIPDINSKTPLERSESPICTRFSSWGQHDPSRNKSPWGQKPTPHFPRHHALTPKPDFQGRHNKSRSHGHAHQSRRSVSVPPMHVTQPLPPRAPPPSFLAPLVSFKRRKAPIPVDHGQMFHDHEQEQRSEWVAAQNILESKARCGGRSMESQPGQPPISHSEEIRMTGRPRMWSKS